MRMPLHDVAILMKVWEFLVRARYLARPTIWCGESRGCGHYHLRVLS